MSRARPCYVSSSAGVTTIIKIGDGVRKSISDTAVNITLETLVNLLTSRLRPLFFLSELVDFLTPSPIFPVREFCQEGEEYGRDAALLGIE